MATVVEKINPAVMAQRNVYSRPCFGVLAWVSAAAEITFENGRTFTVGIAGGYNAMGIFGHEGNGVFVGDDDNGQVVLNKVCYSTNGLASPTRAQLRMYEQLKRMDWAQFRAWVNYHGPAVLRYKI